MKKVTKLIAGVVLAASVAATAGMFAGCGKDNEEPQPQPQPQETTYTGSYAYKSSWGNGYYGVKVDVKVADGKITSVALAQGQPDGWTNITASWDKDGSKAAGVADYLKKFEGKKVDDILAMNVSVDANGQPVTSDDGDASQGDLIYTGATQTSGRLILAVQDALAPAYEGEYSYSVTYGTSTTTYGVKVVVKVLHDKITSVSYAAEQPDGWTNVTGKWDTDGSKAAGVPNYLVKFMGANVDDVLGLTVKVGTNKVPDTTTEGQQSQGDYIYTGATQTSGRIILAVQNALKDNFYCGTATTNYYSTDITINTVVAVKDGKISELYVSDDSVIATGGNWITKFNAGVAAMNTSLIGKTVAEVLALETTYTPAENTLGTVATGATVSSNLYVASIKDALSGLAE